MKGDDESNRNKDGSKTENRKVVRIKYSSYALHFCCFYMLGFKLLRTTDFLATVSAPFFTSGWAYRKAWTK